MISESNEKIKEVAIQCIQKEADAVGQLTNFVDDGFVQSVKIMFHATEGRIIVTGIGKSAIIGQKMVATLNSTGTPAIFMHAADAIHGDLGIIQPNDVVVCISKSGNTPEIKMLLPMIRMRDNKVVAIVGNTESYLAKQADFVVNSTVSKEACPNNLAPTSSTTAQLVMADALAVCLMSLRGFSAQDFARYHPGGTLGKQLYLKVRDLSKDNECPQVSPEDELNTVIYEISSKRLGMTAVLDSGRQIVGIITDGDLRRMLHKTSDVLSVRAKDIMSPHPKTIHEDELVVKALEIMRKNSITSVLVVDDENRYTGVIHLHDIIKEGII
ncbi:MAG: KpsF/GutQ family sugar-phosphate isomerase [Bacteroidales bacterium]|nr:KpsF/GutQ family sugar-phosphate isomerase [Bacteroidales bacterium]